MLCKRTGLATRCQRVCGAVISSKSSETKTSDLLPCLEEISSPRTRINLSFAALKPCCNVTIQRQKHIGAVSAWIFTNFLVVIIHINLTLRNMFVFLNLKKMKKSSSLPFKFLLISCSRNFKFNFADVLYNLKSL